MSGVVLDTNVLVDHMLRAELNSSVAIAQARKSKVIVCEKLLREYRHQIAGGNPLFYGIATLQLMQLFPNLVNCNDPRIRIDFGPSEDRFHMQLAIDEKAQYHVTKENEILAQYANMLKFGVKERHPQQYAREAQADALARNARPATNQDPARHPGSHS